MLFIVAKGYMLRAFRIVQFISGIYSYYYLVILIIIILKVYMFKTIL